jgi:hypothetical protein
MKLDLIKICKKSYPEFYKSEILANEFNCSLLFNHGYTLSQEEIKLISSLEYFLKNNYDLRFLYQQFEKKNGILSNKASIILNSIMYSLNHDLTSYDDLISPP